VRSYVRCRCEKSVIVYFKVIINITVYVGIYTYMCVCISYSLLVVLGW